jgi:uncharacterized protein with ATP-grasp and redox domains
MKLGGLKNPPEKIHYKIKMNNTYRDTNIKKMRYEVDGRCMACQFKSFERLMDKYKVQYDDRQQFFGFFNLTMGQSAALSMPEIHRKLNNRFCEIIQVTDPYADEKIESNALMLTLYDKFKIEVLESSNPFNMALRLSIAGNIIDYGAGSEFDIDKTIQHVLSSEFSIDHSLELEQRIKRAKKILYIGDNAGEIVFDKLFAETIMHNNLTFAVRGSAVLNDATMNDALQTGMNRVVDVIHNGFDAPSTILNECSPEFLSVYNEADLIISKGQGNLEGLIDENDSRIFFLLMVKCNVVAELLGVENGSFVVWNKNTTPSL